MAILKKPVKKKVEEETIPMFHKGDKVSFVSDGDTYEGKIIKTDGEVANVQVGDDEYAVEHAELSPAGESDPEPEPLKKKVGKVEKEVPKKKGKGDSFTSAFKSAKVASKTVGLPVGKYEALVVEAGINESEKGTSGFLKYTVVNDDDVEGKSGVSFYQLMDADKEEQVGMEYFKRDIFSLGLDEDALDACESQEEVVELLEELAEKQIWCNIQVVLKKGYTNIFLQSVEEDQDAKPELPETE